MIALFGPGAGKTAELKKLRRVTGLVSLLAVPKRLVYHNDWGFHA
jgi:hypothetical protein